VTEFARNTAPLKEAANKADGGTYSPDYGVSLSSALDIDLSECNPSPNSNRRPRGCGSPGWFEVIMIMCMFQVVRVYLE
jgi:hypothetical protein